MSVHVLSYVFKNSKAQVGSRLVILTLAEFAHDDGTKAFPSVATIAERTLLSERQVQYNLRKLEDMGEIVNTGKTKVGTNIYTVVMDGGANIAPAQSAASGAQSVTEGAQSIAPDPLEDPLEDPLAAAPQKERPADPIWDELEAIFGRTTNDNARGKRNKAVKLLRQSEAEPDEIRARAAEYKRRYPDVAFTDMALVNQWDNLAVTAVDTQAAVRAMEDREAEERRAEEAEAVDPEESARRAHELLQHLKGNA